MGGEGGGFEHIAVTAADEDEIVVAGEVKAAPRENVPVTSRVAESGQALGASAPPAWDRGEPRDGASRETTLEDLEPGPVPLAQKIVIIAAVVCIIGALVYYFVAMR